MSFYSDASLVMIPSGYKTSKVYCAVPTDGTADLSFTRSNDTATRVNSAGLIEKVRTNLVLQSNTFNTTWTASNASVTSGQAGYDGTNNAWLLSKSAASGYISQGPASSGSETISVYAKAGTDNWLYILVRDNASVFFGGYFDLQNGVVGSATGATTLKIESVGNGWYRCSASFVKSTSTYYRIYPAEGNNDTSGTSGNILIQAAQLETGDIATDYIATTTAAVSVGPVANVPRLDYLNSSCPRLLLEPQRQNVCLWSEQIDNAGWTKNNAPTITTNIATAPDGYGGADGIQDTTGGTFKRIRQLFSVTANSTNTASVFVKKETTQTNFGGLALTYTGGTTIKFAYGIINPIAGTIVVSSDSVIGATSTKVEDYGNWWRFSLTATDNGSNTTLEIAYYGTISTNGTSTGLGTGSVRTVWGFQLEIGATYSTSYIPTLGAAVTRGADAASKTGISSLIGQTEGVLFVDFVQNNTPASGVQQWLFFLGSGSAYIAIFISSGQKLRANVANTTDQAIIDTSFNLVAGTRYKAALAYKENDFAFYVNGVQVGVDTSGTVPALSTLQNNYNTTAANSSNAGLNQALLFKTRLLNSDLAALTA